MSKPAKRFRVRDFRLINLWLLLLSTLLAVGTAEMALRATGHLPWRNFRVDANEPTLHEPDPVLGWKNKPGTYRIPRYHPAGRDVQITILPDGRRQSRPDSPPAGNSLPLLVCVGGSYTMGWALSDQETFAWQLQRDFPRADVRNYGVAGYGTLQCLLLLEKILPALNHPALVVYGFHEHHEVRNVAPARWLAALSKYSRRGHVYLPYATLDRGGNWVRHAPERYPAWPLRTHSALITAMEELFVKIRAYRRTRQKREVTEALLREMNALCTKWGATLLVVILRASDAAKAHYQPFLTRSGIRWLDCAEPLREDLVVKGEGHPNGRLNRRWAEAVSRYLRQHPAWLHGDN